MKVAFIILLTDEIGEGPDKEIAQIRKEVLSKMRYWQIEKITILPHNSIKKDST
jgi:hypothetical protein